MFVFPTALIVMTVYREGMSPLVLESLGAQMHSRHLAPGQICARP